MEASPENETQGYASVLIAMIRELHEGHHQLLDALVAAEQTLLADMEHHQKQSFLDYRELLDELQTLYHVAAYDAGRKAAGNGRAGAPNHARAEQDALGHPHGNR